MKKITLFLTLTALLVSFSCFAAQAEARRGETLRIGALPAADSLALHVAQEEGLFADEGLCVEIVPFQSALEQAAAARSGGIHGFFGDLVTVILMHESGVAQRIIATTSYSTPDARFFGIAVAPGSTHHTLADLRGAKVAIGRATIVDYMLDCILEDHKYPADFVEHVDIRHIAVRLQMLVSGQIDAAVLPEPLLSLAETQGARIVADNRNLAMPLAVVSLGQQYATPATVESFQKALGRAMQRINANPDEYRARMLEKRMLPKGVDKTYTMLRFDPNFTPVPLPAMADLDHVAAWIFNKKLLRRLPESRSIVHEPR